MWSVAVWLSVVFSAVMVEKVCAAPLVCAGGQTNESVVTEHARGKPAGTPKQGQRGALVLFATFANDDAWPTVPGWGAQLLDPALPGSLSHFYDTMSFGALKVRGRPAPEVYASRHAASHYVSADPVQSGRYGEFCLEVLQGADTDVDFSQFDNDGPDGIPSSGDDDGLVDAVFIVIRDAPRGLILGPATGTGDLGDWGEYVTEDQGQDGKPIRVATYLGTLQQGATFAEASGAMCHEFGHVLGLPDLYDTAYLREPNAPPEEDSAGIGAWGLMGWGALGWAGTPGPNSLCAWSRLRLGWGELLEPDGLDVSIQLEQVGVSGQVYWIPLSGREYLLLEYRRRSSTYYDRGIPGEGLLVWHVGRDEYGGEKTPWWKVDLVCADGRWTDAGFPYGSVPQPHAGGDNLDFWAHDVAYAAAHGGNLGDRTDPFDGVTYSSFTPETNPPATSRDGEHSIHLEDITLIGDMLRAQVKMSAPAVELTDLRPQSERVAAGEAVAITFHLTNTGASPATGLRAELRTSDELLEIVDSYLDLSPLRPGDRSIGSSVSPRGFPRARFPAGLDRLHAATVELTVHGPGGQLAGGTAVVTGVPSHRVSATVVDSGGHPLPGMTVRLAEPWNARTEVYFDGTTETDSSGLAIFHVPTGSYRLGAEPAQASRWGDVELADLWIDGDTEVELSLPITFTLTGTIRDVRGTPVNGHYVRLVSTATGGTWRYTWTNLEGRYSVKLPVGEYEVTTRSVISGVTIPEQTHGRIEVTGDMELDIALEDGVDVTVDVVDESGAPINGIQIFYYRSGGTSLGSVAYSVTRAGEGATEEVMPGSYELSIDRVPAPYILPRERTPVTALTDTMVTVALRRGVSLELSLVDEAGQGIETQDYGSVYLTSLDDGTTYSTQLSPGPAEATVGVLPGKYQAYVYMYSPSSADSPRVPSQSLGVVEVKGDTAMVLLASSGVLVSGQLQGRLGKVGTYSSLSLVSESGSSASARLRADGSFSARLTPGQYTVRAYFNAGEMAPPSQSLGTFTVTADTVVKWHLMDDETVRGRLVDIGGQGVGGLQILAAAIIDGETVSNGATTGSDGAYEIRLPVARYPLRAYESTSEGTVIWYLGDIEVPAIVAPDVFLPSGGQLTARVTNATGQPSPARIRLFDNAYSLAKHLVAIPAVDIQLRDASAREVELAPGGYSAVVSPDNSSMPSYSRVVDRLVVDEGASLEAALPSPGGSAVVSGSVVRADGRDLTTTYIYAYRPETGLLVGASVEAGRYILDLPPGSYELAARFYREGEYVARKLGQLAVDGDRPWDITLGDPTAVEETQTAALPRLALRQNYPNPFNSSTAIEFTTSVGGRVAISLYDLLGQRVRDLASGEWAAGNHVVRWDGRDDEGRPLATGVYLYSLETAAGIATRKSLLLR